MRLQPSLALRAESQDYVRLNHPRWTLTAAMRLIAW